MFSERIVIRVISTPSSASPLTSIGTLREGPPEDKSKEDTNERIFMIGRFLTKYSQAIGLLHEHIQKILPP